jgi:DNA primase
MSAAEQIAQKYLEKVRLKDDFVSAACPFHKDGKERHPSFWIQRSTGKWGCFACPASGRDLKQLLRELGVKNRSLEAEIDEATKEAKKHQTVEKAVREKKARAEFKGTHILPESLLGVFDFLPLDLTHTGFGERLLREHDIGFDVRYHRITFPVRDMFGNLVGISGRATLPGDAPKYLFYSGRRTTNGKKDNRELGEWCPDYSNASVRDHLWRGNFVAKDLLEGSWDQLIIVEGFKAALWLVQNGWYHTVAIMGTQMSPAQERIIRRFGSTVFALADNNEPGRDASLTWCQRLSSSSFPVYQVRYPDYCDETVQPDNLSREELEEMFRGSKRFVGTRNDFHKKLETRSA